MLPGGLAFVLLTLDNGLAGAGPVGLVELDAAALCLNGVGGGDDNDDAEGLEMDWQGAVDREVAVGVERGGK